MIIHSTAGLIWKISIGMSQYCQYFPESYERFSGRVKVELDLSDYVRKADLKRAIRIDASLLASKTNLTGLKIKVDNLM